MALFNEIQESGLNQLIIKRLNMQTGTAVPAVQPELAMDLTLESDRVEWGFLKGEYRFSAGAVQAAPAAGNHATFGIENPTSSAILVTIEECGSDVEARLGIGTTVPWTPVTTGFGARRDLRQPLTGRSPWTIGTTLTASLPGRSGYIFPNSFTKLEFVLSPGSFFGIFSTVAATGMSSYIAWRERPAGIGELG